MNIHREKPTARDAVIRSARFGAADTSATSGPCLRDTIGALLPYSWTTALKKGPRHLGHLGTRNRGIFFRSIL